MEKQQLEQSSGARGWPDMMVATDKGQLLKAVARALRRGELAAVGPLQPARGVWYVQVIRLRRTPAPRKVWPWVVGGTVAGLVVAAAVGWWLASVVSILVPLGALAGVLLLVGGLMVAPSGCTITHVRH